MTMPQAQNLQNYSSTPITIILRSTSCTATTGTDARPDSSRICTTCGGPGLQTQQCRRSPTVERHRQHVRAPTHKGDNRSAHHQDSIGRLGHGRHCRCIHRRRCGDSSPPRLLRLHPRGSRREQSQRWCLTWESNRKKTNLRTHRRRQLYRERTVLRCTHRQIRRRVHLHRRGRMRNRVRWSTPAKPK